MPHAGSVLSCGTGSPVPPRPCHGRPTRHRSVSPAKERAPPNLSKITAPTLNSRYEIGNDEQKRTETKMGISQCYMSVSVCPVGHCGGSTGRHSIPRNRPAVPHPSQTAAVDAPRRKHGHHRPTWRAEQRLSLGYCGE